MATFKSLLCSFGFIYIRKTFVTFTMIIAIFLIMSSTPSPMILSVKFVTLLSLYSTRFLHRAINVSKVLGDIVLDFSYLKIYFIVLTNDAKIKIKIYSFLLMRCYFRNTIHSYKNRDHKKYNE